MPAPVDGHWLELARTASDSPWFLRVSIGLIGGILLLAGHRVYKGALFGSTFALGAIGATLAAQAGGTYIAAFTRPEVVALVAVLAGAVVAGTAAMAHKVALLAVGGVTGIAVGVATGDLIGGQAALIAPVAGALVGALSFPWLFESLLKFTTPAVGAVSVAWAAGRPEDLLLLGALYAIGVALQVGPLRKRASTSGE